MGKIVLVTGGARSGKSVFAEKYTEKFGKNISYIATAEVYDDEMRKRISLHKERRPKEWKTYEYPKNAYLAIEKAGQDSDMILFDCLTIYLSNIILSIENSIDEKIINNEINLLINSAKKNSGDDCFCNKRGGCWNSSGK